LGGGGVLTEDESIAGQTVAGGFKVVTMGVGGVIGDSDDSFGSADGGWVIPAADNPEEV